MAGFYCAGWMMICGIICNHTKPLYGWIAMIVGILVILGVSFSLWIILNELGRNVKRTKKIKVLIIIKILKIFNIIKSILYLILVVQS